MQRTVKNLDFVPFKGIFEIFRYKSDGKTLICPPYRDKNTIVNIGRQLIRGCISDAGDWSNTPTIGPSWGDLSPVSNADLFIEKMKLGVSSIGASPADEELIAPIGSGTIRENMYTGNGVTLIFGPYVTVGTPVLRKTVVITTWVQVSTVPNVTTYLYGIDDGNGTISGSKDVYVTGTGWVTVSMSANINYLTRTISAITYSHAPVNGTDIDVVFDTTTLATNLWVAGGSVYNHTLSSVPISHDTLSIVPSGSGVTGLASDDGSGVINGTFTGGGGTVTGSINYTTGALVLNFSTPVPANVTFTFTYKEDWSRATSVYFPSPYSTRFEITLAAGEFTDYRFAEEGLFTDDTLDIPLARKAFTPFTKAPGEITVFRHTIIF